MQQHYLPHVMENVTRETEIQCWTQLNLCLHIIFDVCRFYYISGYYQKWSWPKREIFQVCLTNEKSLFFKIWFHWICHSLISLKIALRCHHTVSCGDPRVIVNQVQTMYTSLIDKSSWFSDSYLIWFDDTKQFVLIRLKRKMKNNNLEYCFKIRHLNW